MPIPLRYALVSDPVLFIRIPGKRASIGKYAGRNSFPYIISIAYLPKNAAAIHKIKEKKKACLQLVAVNSAASFLFVDDTVGNKTKLIVLIQLA